MLPDKQSYEVVDAIELAQRWRVPVSWIREQTRNRAADPLPACGWAVTSVSSGGAQSWPSGGNTAGIAFSLD